MKHPKHVEDIKFSSIEIIAKNDGSIIDEHLCGMKNYFSFCNYCYKKKKNLTYRIHQSQRVLEERQGENINQTLNKEKKENQRKEMNMLQVKKIIKNKLRR